MGYPKRHLKSTVLSALRYKDPRQPQTGLMLDWIGIKMSLVSDKEWFFFARSRKEASQFVGPNKNLLQMAFSSDNDSQYPFVVLIYKPRH